MRPRKALDKPATKGWVKPLQELLIPSLIYVVFRVATDGASQGNSSSLDNRHYKPYEAL